MHASVVMTVLAADRPGLVRALSETIAAHAMPAFRPHFYSLERSQDVFSWDPL